MFSRKKKTSQNAEGSPLDSAPAVTGPRADGPWDVTERVPDAEYIDFGSLKVRGRENLSLQLPTENDQIVAVAVLAENSILELRPFASSKAGGQWELVCAELLAQVGSFGGRLTQQDGPFGPELHGELPVGEAEGKTVVQPARLLGIEGPRWMLRATLLGEAAVNEEAAQFLTEVLHDVIVARGAEPRPVGEALPIQMPQGLTASPTVPTADDDQS